VNQLKIIYYAAKNSTINIKTKESQASKYAQSHICGQQLNR